MSKTVYLVCGVSGSGKSWVCRQLGEKFHYIPHDEHYHDFEPTLIKAAEEHDRPVISEVPFAERKVREALEWAGVKVVPVFVVEAPDVVAKRFHGREGRPASKSAMTRATTIMKRVKEWKAFHGTSDEVLKHLTELELGKKAS